MKSKEEIEERIDKHQESLSILEKQRQDLLVRSTKNEIDDKDFMLEWDIIASRIRVFGQAINDLKWVIS